MRKMTKIKKHLDEIGIQYTKLRDRLEIMIEEDCVWVNGYGEEMLWDRAIGIITNAYGDYIVVEKVGYSETHRHLWTRKQDSVIELIDRLFGK